MKIPYFFGSNRRRRTGILLVVTVVLGLVVTGCASYSGGDQHLTGTAVAHIKKGVTTEAQVIALLGQPDSISMMGDGRRMLMYTRTQGSVNNSQMGLDFIPFAGGLIPVHTSQTTRMRTLQIIIGKNHIVQDYQYSDNARETNTTSSMFGGHVQETAVTPTTQP